MGSFHTKKDAHGRMGFFWDYVSPYWYENNIHGVGIWRIVNGKAVERKSVRDLLDFLRQLGVIEPTEKVKKLFP
jgi:hypothetical protein